jgi:peptidoglycan/LPS O-acetylase OafA/YrhL
MSTSTSATARNRSARWRPDIQGLRAIAIASVVLYHANVPWISGGFVGVDVFFVVSGFLITSQLLHEILPTGRLAFGRFYARRARRILPASFVVILGTLAAAVLLVPPTELRTVAVDAMATALYFPNVLFAVRGTNYLNQTAAPSLYQHFWSLGVEEQFYLVWPLLIVVVYFLSRRRRLVLGIVLAIVAVLSLAAGIHATTTDEPMAFFMLPFRAWEFASGGLVALALSGQRRLPAPVGAGIAWAGLAAVAAAIFLFTSSTEFPGYSAVLPVAGTATVILGGASASRWGPARLLSIGPAVFIGEISYSLYLVHWPLLTITQAHVGLGNPLPVSDQVLLVLIGVPIAWLIYRFVENPVRRNRKLSSARPRTTLVGALAGSAGLVLMATAGAAYAARAPLTTNVVLVSAALAKHPKPSTVVPRNLTPSLAQAANDVPLVYRDGCHLGFGQPAIAKHCSFGPSRRAPEVALFGDSHAAQWFPALDALAKAGRIRLVSYTKSGCPSAEINVLFTATPSNVPYPTCPVWRGSVITALKAAPPAAIIVSSDPELPIAGGGYPSAAAWQKASKALLAKLPKRSKTVLIGATPLPGIAPSSCLSAHLANAAACDLKRTRSLPPALQRAEKQAAKSAKAHYLDMSDYMCNRNTCPAVIGHDLVYRDGSHLTATYAKSLAPVIKDELTRLLGRSALRLRS